MMKRVRSIGHKKFEMILNPYRTTDLGRGGEGGWRRESESGRIYSAPDGDGLTGVEVGGSTAALRGGVDTFVMESWVVRGDVHDVPLNTASTIK